MGIRFVSTRDSLLLAYSSDGKGSCLHREASASQVSNGMGRIAGLYHVMNENLVESDTIDLKISVSGDESLYRIALIRDYYYVFASYFLGGEQHPVNLLISTSIPISDELFRETGLIGDILERASMGYDPVVIGGKHPDAMPMAFFFSKPTY